ncbi:MAG TPA: TMEM175 family protein [Streptosporangiaceae bacterium]
MGKGRTESFSDGVLAVAITLLALDLHVAPGSARLWSQVVHQWPSFAAYAVSFYVIGVIWVTHHGLFALITRVDRVLLFENLLLLMFVVAIPFTTATLADFVQSPSAADARVAVLLYGLSDIGMAFSFTAMFSRVVHHGLLEVPVDRVTARRAVRRFGLGTIGYPAAMAAGLIWPPLILAGIAALTGYYMLAETRVTPVAGCEDADCPGSGTQHRPRG